MTHINPFSKIRDIEYLSLVDKIANSSLRIGKHYKITDFQTLYKQRVPNGQGTGGTNLLEKVQGYVEPLVVFAVSSNELSPIAFSPQFPEDIIYYSPDVDFHFATTPVSNEPVYYVQGALKGVIYRRIDTRRNISMPYDFRNMEFSLFANTYPTYDGGTTYAQRAKVKNPANTEIYISLVNSNNGNALTDDSKWKKLPYLSNNDYVHANPNTGPAMGSYVNRTTFNNAKDIKNVYVGQVESVTDEISIIFSEDVYNFHVDTGPIFLHSKEDIRNCSFTNAEGVIFLKGANNLNLKNVSSFHSYGNAPSFVSSLNIFNLDFIGSVSYVDINYFSSVILNNVSDVQGESMYQSVMSETISNVIFDGVQLDNFIESSVGPLSTSTSVKVFKNSSSTLGYTYYDGSNVLQVSANFS